MKQAKRTLPDFADPPVIEVAVSLMFSPLRALRVPHLGLLWNEYRDRYPVVEEHPPLAPARELFGTLPEKQMKLRVEFSALQPVPRVWFLNQPGTELIQVQQDRFVFNWRKAGNGHDYPRFEPILETFLKELATFQRFLASEHFPELEPLQCELTYVNHVSLRGADHALQDPWDVLGVLQPLRAATFLPAPEDIRVGIRYVMTGDNNEPVGRLIIESDPGYSLGDNEPVILLKLTARGEPEGPSLDGMVRFLRRGRIWIVSGFADLTTSKMHVEWGRKQ